MCGPAILRGDSWRAVPARAVCTTVKGAEERGDLPFASVHAVRQSEEHGVIFFAEGEDRCVHTAFLEVLETTLQIMS